MISFVENLLILSSLFFSLSAYYIWGFKIVIDSLVILFGAKLFERSYDLKTYLSWAVLQPIYIPIIGVLGLLALPNFSLASSNERVLLVACYSVTVAC